MKKKSTLLFFSALLCCSAAFAQDPFETQGNGTAYTLESLSQTAGSGVTKDGNTYTMLNSIKITAGDSFSLSDGVTVKMGDGVQLSVDGTADFEAASNAVFTKNADSDKPKGIAISEAPELTKFKNIDFEYCGLRSFSEAGISVEKCTFKYNNGEQSSTAALALGGIGSENTIKDCEFIENTVPGVGNGANMPCGITIDNCYFFDNNTENANKPQINVTVPGDKELRITNCTLVGNQRTKVGGIAVGNMMSIAGTNKVVIDGNTIEDHRYGITTIGSMDAVISNNTMINNKYETNPMAGGSGISISDSSGTQTVMISGNHIEGSLWGITIIGGKDINLGKTEVDPSAPDYNPGRNTFVDNGNNGQLYDLYNNTKLTIYAQGNKWNVDEQTEEKIETVIFHKKDQSSLGEVFFMPPMDDAGLNETAAECIRFDGKSRCIVMTAPADVDIYSLDGHLAVSYTDAQTVDVSGMAPGTYIARVKTGKGFACLKFIL